MNILKQLFLISMFLPFSAVIAQKAEGSASTTAPAIMTKYDSVITRADSCVYNQQFDKAKELYKQAILLSPDNPYPVRMLTEVQNSIVTITKGQARDEELKRKAEVNVLMDKALKEVVNKNYDSARALYVRVLTLKPIKSLEEFAKKKIESIDFALASTPKNQTSNSTSSVATKTPSKTQKFAASPVAVEKSIVAPVVVNQPVEPQPTQADRLMERALKASEDADATAAINLYKEVLASNPNKTQQKLARKKIDSLEASLKEISRKAAEKETAAQEAAQQIQAAPRETPSPAPATAPTNTVAATPPQQRYDLQRKAQFDSLIEKAAQLAKNENWQAALDDYQQSLTLFPAKADEEMVKKRMRSINAKIEKSQKKATERSEVAAAPVATRPAPKMNQSEDFKPIAYKNENAYVSSSNTSFATLSTQQEATPFTREELSRKYPSINFNKLPEDQIIDSSDIANTAQNAEFSKKLLSEPSQFNISDSSNNIKLICQGVTLNGKNLYLRFLIQNYNPTSEFVLGAQQLMYIKNYGILKRLNARHISNFPIVLPQKQFPVVYVAQAPTGIEPNEVFVFELEDRMKKTKLTVNIHGEDFLRTRTN